MALIMLNGVAYSTPLVEIQNNSSATSLDALKIPTGQTVTSVLSGFMKKGVDYVTAGLQSGETVGNKTTVEGFNNKGRGDYNHIEGSNNGDNLASRNVHIEGEDNAIGGSGQYGLHIEGKGNDGHYAANYAHIGGKYAKVDSINGADWAYLVGNGTADNSRSNAFGVTWDGDAIAGRSNGLGDNRKLVTGADVISYLNSNIVNDYIYISVNTTANSCININNAASLHFEHGSSMPPGYGWIPVVRNHATKANSLDVVTADGQSWYIYSDTSQKTYIMFYKIAYRSS